MNVKWNLFVIKHCELIAFSLCKLPLFVYKFYMNLYQLNSELILILNSMQHMEFLKLSILIAQLICGVCGKVVIIPDTSKFIWAENYVRGWRSAMIYDVTIKGFRYLMFSWGEL